MARLSHSPGGNMTQNSRLLSLDDAAHALRVSRGTVKNIVRSGALASLTIGTRRLITPEALEAYIAAREAEAQK
jgi:excisionase family DNA binding protein